MPSSTSFRHRHLSILDAGVVERVVDQPIGRSPYNPTRRVHIVPPIMPMLFSSEERFI